MAEYVTYQETIDFLNTDECEGVPQSTIETLITAGQEMIDEFLNGRKLERVPSLVKVVNMELVRAMLADATKNAESIEGYSYTANPSAFSNILARLNYITFEDEAIGEVGKYIRARLL